jgi:hypothetical protein
VRSGGQTAPIEVDPRFQVRAASDVIHPRMMEFLMERAAAGLPDRGRCAALSVDKHDTQLIGLCADLAHEFLGRVPIGPLASETVVIQDPSDRHSGAIGQVQI